MSDAELIDKGPCPECGSSDACARYDDGHSFCFSCETPFPAGDGDGTETVRSNGKKTRRDRRKEIPGTPRPIKSRKLRVDTCRKYGYLVGKHHGEYVQIAEYRKAGKIVAQHVRTADKEFYWIGKSKDVDLFGSHLWRSGGKRIVITEGEIDCMTVAQVFGLSLPVVSLPNGASSAKKFISHHLEYLDSFDEIVLAFDDDKPGREAIEKCIGLFSPGKVVVPYYEGRKDANELYMDKGPKALARCIQESRPYRPDSIINGRDIFKRIVEAKDSSGIEILYPELSGMLHGVGPRRIYLFTAGAGIGKSTIVHEIAHDIVEKTGDKLGVLALEEDPGEAAMRHMSISVDKPLHLLDMPKKDLEEIHKDVFKDGRYEFYDHFGSQDIDAILSKIRFMAVALGCRWIILDHISIVVSGQESIHEADWKRLDRLMTNLRSLVDETKIGILAVAHLKRPDNKGKSYNEGRKVALTDLRGSAALEQLSDIVIAAERDQQGKDPNRLTLRMLKNRKAGKTGPADTLEYNPITGRLLAATEGGHGGISGTSESATSGLPTDF